MATRLKTKWIDDLAVTEAKLANNAVTTDKINSNAITSGKILDDAVTNAKLDTTAVDTINMVDDAVTNAKLDTTAVDTANMVDAAVTSDKLNSAVAGDGLAGAGGSALSIQADGTSLTVGASGVKISSGGIDSDMISGAIPDSKLEQLTTADKVAASAVEDKFIRNDVDDTSAGKISAAGFDAQSNVISSIADGVDNADAVSVAQLNQVSTESKAWKEAVLHPSQLVDGTSGGLMSAQVLHATANLVTGDTITLNDGTGTESYVADTEFAVGADINETLDNLNVVVNAGAIAVSSVVTDLQSVDGTANVLIFVQDTVGEPTRVYGDAAAATRLNLLPAASLYSGDAGDLIPIPTSDPSATNFGFFRDRTDLVISETHLTRSANATYTWDDDATSWELSGEGSIPLASESVFGKVKISNGISVSGGIISADPDAVGGLNLASSIDVNSNGIAVKVDEASIDENGSGQLEVVDGGITAAKLDTTSVSTAKIVDDAVTAAKVNADVAGIGLTQDGTGALQVNVDDTTLEISADVVQVKDGGISGTQLASDIDISTTGNITSTAGTFTGDGAGLTNLPTVGSTDSVILTAKKATAGTLAKGKPLYVSGFSSPDILVEAADADDPTKMPAIGIVATTITDSTAGTVVFSGKLELLDTSLWSVGDELWVSESSDLSDTKPTGNSAQIQKVAQVLVSDSTAGVLQVFGAGRSNDLPNITDDNLWIGNGSDVPTQTPIGNGLDSTAGTSISVKADGVGGANLATAIDVNSNGVAVKVDGATIGENGSSQLEVKSDSIDSTHIDETDDFTWTGTHDFTGGSVFVPTPTVADHAVNKSYVDSQVTDVNEFVSEQRTISAGEVTASALTLAQSPESSSSVSMDVLGGMRQNNGTDFIVTGTTVDWTNQGLEGVLEENDIVVITYSA